MKRPSIVASYPMIMESTGLMPSPYFSAAKAAWIMEHIQPKEKLLFGTMDSWVLWKLTGNHVTDFSNASRTQLFHIRDLRWDPNLLELFGLQNVEMPQVKCSDEIFGYTTAEGIFPHPIPVSGIMGDSHGALFGQQCWQRGMAKCTFGTGGSVMMNIGDVPLPSQNRLATSIAWGLGGAVTYVFEGVIMSMGDTIRWLADEMGLIQNSGQSEPLAEQVPSTGGVYLVPAFGGLGAPYWNSTARGLICGIQRDTDKRHVVRAGLESIAYQIRDIIEPMAKDAGLCFSELRVDGGPTNNRWLMQFTADLLGVSVVKNDVEELSSLGAAYAGGLATGFWKDREELESLRKTADIYQRKVSEKTADDCYQGWKQAVSFLTKT